MAVNLSVPRPGSSAKKRTLESPLLFTALFLLTLYIAYRWLLLLLPVPAPVLPNWDWKQHPYTMMIPYFPDCGCSTSLMTAVSNSAARGQEVLIVTHQSREASANLESFVSDRVHLMTDADEAMLLRFNPNKRVVAVPVENGYIPH